MAELKITKDNFEAEVIQSKEPVLWISGRSGARPVRCSHRW